MALNDPPTKDARVGPAPIHGGSRYQTLRMSRRARSEYWEKRRTVIKRW